MAGPSRDQRSPVPASVYWVSVRFVQRNPGRPHVAMRYIRAWGPSRLCRPLGSGPAGGATVRRRRHGVRPRRGPPAATLPGEPQPHLPPGPPAADLRPLHTHHLPQRVPRRLRRAGQDHPRGRALPHGASQPREYPSAPGAGAGTWRPPSPGWSPPGRMTSSRSPRALPFPSWSLTALHGRRPCVCARSGPCVCVCARACYMGTFTV